MIIALLLQVVTRDVSYYDGADRHERKHNLDVYAPEGASDLPVLFFVHGGAWASGDKALYGGLGENWAGEGFVTVVANYRLSPEVEHPAHIEDVARAFAWTVAHVAEHGGDPENIFVAGHSAGGHLVALLATDDRYLEAHELTIANIRGVIGISGAYVVGPMPGIFEAADAREASPMTHVDGTMPPFLVIWADRDSYSLDRVGAEFAEAIEGAGSSVRSLEVEDRTHITILTRMQREDDPARAAVLEFVEANRR